MGNCQGFCSAGHPGFLDCRQYVDKSGKPSTATRPTKEAPTPDASQTSAAPAVVVVEKEKPKPKVFALMRNGHEVIRGAMIDVQDLLEKGDLEGAKEMFHKLEKWERMHMLMEEGRGDGETPKGMFAMLDENFDGVAEQGGLRDEHVAMDAIETEVKEALEAGSLEEARMAYAKFKESNEAHLKKEESIMMPKVMELVKRGGNLKKIMTTEILPLIVDSPDFEFWVSFANQILDAHPGGMPRARVFDHALFACATPEQWKKWNRWICASLPPERYAEVCEAIGQSPEVFC